MIGTLMRDFHMSEPQAMKYPLNRAFALLAFHGVRHPMGSMEIAGDGYIAQERWRASAASQTTNPPIH